MSENQPPEQPSYGSDPAPSPPSPQGPPDPTNPPSPQGPPSPQAHQGHPGHQGPQPVTPMQGTQGGGLNRNIPGAAMAALPDGSGFLGALFDFSFNRFVTPMLVKLVYVLATIYAVFVYLVVVVVGFASGGFWTGLTALILGPIGAIIWLAVVRIGLEFGISVVRMSQDVHERLPQA